jgi:site-specific DNA recombinase
MTAKRIIRCAIYARKSSEEGLEMDFNSLDAQREACEAYISSQKAEGWTAMKERFDDGGYSGGTLERPALKRLLSAIEAGLVDVVVVYKIDRLSRSLLDFAKLVEVFDRKTVSFVSITQSFSTVTSMGRLTLNVLLSFAQFEREVTGERIRDKIAASKKKGIWMGGIPPLGYEVSNRKLVVIPSEAETVRHVFERYLQLGNIRSLLEDLARTEIHSKRRTYPDGRACGGRPYERASLLKLLRNRIYLGETTHKSRSYRGEHEAIVARPVFAAVQARLEESEPTFRRRSPVAQEAIFQDILFDEQRQPMKPTYAVKRRVRYRYYVSNAPSNGRRLGAQITHLPAAPFEAFVADTLKRVGLDGLDLRALTRRLTVHSHKLVLELDRNLAVAACKTAHGVGGRDKDAIAFMHSRLNAEEDLIDADDSLTLTLPVRAQFRGGRASIVFPESETAAPTPDLVLVKALARACSWRAMLLSGEVHSIDELAQRFGLDRGHTGLTLKLAFLSPKIVRAILAGEQGPGVTLSRILAEDVPLFWDRQDAALSGPK